MKPLYLSIEGMHSFVERQEIDFRQLSDMGMFGIFGPTGSGKSTILDAITLALYGKVGRAMHGTHGVLNHNVDRMEVVYVFELFADGETKRYRLERRYQRKDEQRAELRVCRLQDVTLPGAVSVLADKVSDVENTVRDLIGLTMDDFTKAVVLPQGKFAELLQMKPAERKSMLERLFGLEKYGAKLRNFVGRRLENLRHELELARQGLASLGDASEETLEQTRRELVNASTAEAAAKNTAHLARQGFHRMQGVWGVQQQLAQVDQDIAHLCAKEPAIRLAKAALAASERANRVLSAAVEDQALAAQAAELEQTQRELEARRAQAQVEVEKAELALKDANLRYLAEQPTLVGLQTRLEEARSLELEVQEARQKITPLGEQTVVLQKDLQQTEAQEGRVVAALSQWRDALNEEQALLMANRVDGEERDRLEGLRAKADLLTSAYRQWQQQKQEVMRRRSVHDKAESELSQAKQNLEAKAAVWHGLERNLVWHIEHKPLDEGAAAARGRELERLQSTLKAIQQTEQDLRRAQTEVASAAMKLDDAREQLRGLTAAQAQEAESLSYWETAQQEQIERLLHNQRALLAAELKAGEPCPVCGSTVHPARSAGTGEDALVQAQREVATSITSDIRAAQIEQKLVEAREAVSRSAPELAAAQTLAATLQMQFEAAVTQVDHTEAALQGLREGLPAELRPNPDAPLANQLAHWLSQAEEDLAKTERMLVQWTHDREQLQIELERARRGVGVVESEVSALEVRVELSRNEWTEALSGLSTQEGVVRQGAESLKQDLSELSVIVQNVIVDGPRWIAGQQDEIRRKDEAGQQAHVRSQELEKNLREAQNQLADVQFRKSSLEASLAKAIEQLRAQERWTDDLAKRVESVTGGLSVAAALVQVANQLQELLAQQTAKQAASQNAHQKLQQITQELAVQSTQVMNAREHLHKSRERMGRLLAEEDFVSVQAARDARLTVDEQDGMQDSVTDYEETTRQLTMRRQHMTEQLGEERISENDWQQAQFAQEQAEGLWKAAVEVRAGLENLLRDVEARHERWQALHEKVHQFEQQERLLKEIASLLQGNAFVGFLASEHMDFVAHAASDLFQKLSSNKFALEVDSEGGFLVRDDFNAGKRRFVASLSGGELFQASLSLALALSTQVQLRGSCPLEFFFLDEGFGTLDAERLDKVMTSLEKLQHGSMTIGIISHVPELRQRMPRRLLVEPAEASGQGSRVRIERI